MQNCRMNHIKDRTRWGIIGTNFCKNIVLEDCELSRMDTHMGVAGGYTFRRCTFGWMGLNSYILLTGAFDPYPYILLNLALSTLASLQAPIIMMSQNRQSEKDRLSQANTYEVNLKTELSIQQLHEKVDLLLEDKKA